MSEEDISSSILQSLKVPLSAGTITLVEDTENSG